MVEELQCQLHLLRVSDGECTTATSNSEAPRSLLSLTQTVLDTLKLKLQHFATMKSALDEMKGLLKSKEEEVVLKSQQYSSESEVMKGKVASLEKTVQEKMDMIETINQNNNLLEGELKQLRDTLSGNVMQKNADSSNIKPLQDEIKRLEKGWYDLFYLYLGICGFVKMSWRLFRSEKHVTKEHCS